MSRPAALEEIEENRLMSRRGYQGVAVAVPITVPYERFSERTAVWFFGRALAELLQQSGLGKHDIDGLALSSFSLVPDTPASIAEYFDMQLNWLEHVPYGGASGVIALQRAARAVQAGDAEVVACIAADTNRKGGFRDLVANFSRFSQDAVYPYGAGGPNAVFAMITRHYMKTFGAARKDFGRICVAQRSNALANPNALFKNALTMDDYLNARPIAEPLHLYDCVMPCAGAEAFLVMSGKRARAQGLSYAEVLAAGERYNAYFEDAVHVRGGWLDYRDDLYEQAGCGAQNMDFVQTYDDYPVIVMIQLEDLGFCGKGEAWELVRETELTWNARAGLPHNTSGGQLSCGQAGAAGGFIGLVEAVRQLTGGAGDRQIAGAQRGLVSGYGMVNYDRCLCTSAAILGRPS
jgi:acetyl-CoA acetyltransferase